MPINSQFPRATEQPLRLVWFGLVWKLWLSTSLLVQPMTPRKVHYPQHKEGRDGAVIKPPQESLDTTASDVILLKIIENY